MVGRAVAERIPTAGAPNGHGSAVRDRGAAMAITALNARSRAGTRPPGPPGRPADDRRPDLRGAAVTSGAAMNGGAAVRAAVNSGAAVHGAAAGLASPSAGAA